MLKVSMANLICKNDSPFFCVQTGVLLGAASSINASVLTVSVECPSTSSILLLKFSFEVETGAASQIYKTIKQIC